MKQKIKSAAFMLSLVAFTQANALSAISPDENDLRRVVNENLAALTSLQPLTLKVQSQDGQERTWEVRNPEFYIDETLINRLPLRAGNPLINKVRDIINKNRIVMLDYDMYFIGPGFRPSPQYKTQRLVQFPDKGGETNELAFKLFLSEPKNK